MIVELFAGPGGWSTGARIAGITERMDGIEIDPDACATAVAAGHQRDCVDVTHERPDRWTAARGIIASPPCGPFSAAGYADGLFDHPHVRARMTALAGGGPTAERAWSDWRSPLTAEPMRWIAAIRPEFVALEQVQSVIPLWEHMAALLRDQGYDTWTGVVRAEQFGVPQTRRRAVLLGSRFEPITAPAPTHERPVTMGEALDVDDGRVLVSNYGTGGDPKNRGRRRLDQCAPTMTGRCCRNRWEWPDGTSRNLTLSEAAVLQSFPADYPFRGLKSAQQQQVGDAVPPLLAAGLLAQFIG